MTLTDWTLRSAEAFSDDGLAIVGYGISPNGVTLAWRADLTPPSVSAITTAKPNGAYKAGEVIDIKVAFSEKIAVTGTPTLVLKTGETDHMAGRCPSTPSGHPDR